jgi:hypothetical protein
MRGPGSIRYTSHRACGSRWWALVWLFGGFAVLLTTALEFTTWAATKETKAMRAVPEVDGDVGARIVARGRHFVGRPYVSGGNGHPGFDCSGLVQRLYAEEGYFLPRVSRRQARAGRKVDAGAMRPGDLLFFADAGAPVSHVGIYAGDGRMLHASTNQGKVVIASLRIRWFRERLVSVRRIVGASSLQTRTASLAAGTGMDAEPDLPPGLYGVGQRRRVHVGPSLFEPEDTSLGVRLHTGVQRERFGLSVVPEFALRSRKIGATLSFAVPVRIESSGGATLGRFETPGDYVRFVREIRIGRPDTKVELRLGRTGDLTLSDGFVMNGFVPAYAVSGVTGLSVEQAPLHLSGAIRLKKVETEIAIDDAIDPGLVGLGFRYRPFGSEMGVSFSAVTDQRSENLQGARRAIWAGTMGLFFGLPLGADFTTNLLVEGELAQAEGRNGGAFRAVAEVGYRPEETAFGLETRLGGGYLGAGTLESPFGPTYAASKGAHFDALRSSGDRFFLSGELLLSYGPTTLGISYTDGMGTQSVALDRSIRAELTVSDEQMWSRYGFEAFFRGAVRGVGILQDPPFVLSGGLRYGLLSFLDLEAFVERGPVWAGGIGVSMQWMPDA